MPSVGLNCNFSLKNYYRKLRFHSIVVHILRILGVSWDSTMKKQFSVVIF
jgi:hypothetical protein